MGGKQDERKRMTKRGRGCVRGGREGSVDLSNPEGRERGGARARGREGKGLERVRARERLDDK